MSFIIGSDESLKGDTFGGLIVAAVKADDETRERLVNIGVQDSKKLTPLKVEKLAEQIKEIAHYKIITLTPEEYNKNSQTYWMNKLHSDAGHALKPGKHIVDLYPGCTVGDVQETKAEDAYPEVAAASILARAAGFEQFAALSKKAGFPLPRGSTHVKEALEKLKKKKLDPKKFVKMHFGNVRKALG